MVFDKQVEAEGKHEGAAGWRCARREIQTLGERRWRRSDDGEPSRHPPEVGLISSYRFGLAMPWADAASRCRIGIYVHIVAVGRQRAAIIAARTTTASIKDSFDRLHPCRQTTRVGPGVQADPGESHPNSHEFGYLDVRTQFCTKKGGNGQSGAKPDPLLRLATSRSSGRKVTSSCGPATCGDCRGSC